MTSFLNADNTFRFAKELGYTIPYPLSVSDTRFRFTDGHKQLNEPVIIDDVEMILQAMLGCPIDTITFDSPNVISTEDRYAEEIAELKKELAACYREKDEDQVAIETLKDKCVDLVAEKIVEALRRREEELDKEDSNQD